MSEFTSNGSEPNETLTERVNTRLELVVDPEVEIKDLRGCSAIEGEEVDLDLPEDRKLTVRNLGSEGSPTTYYLKKDAHDSLDAPHFHMPDGKLPADEAFNVRGLSVTENGLRVGVGYQGQGYDFFYINSLEGLEFRVEDKTELEKASELLNANKTVIKEHDFHARQVRESQASLEEAERVVESLPNYSPDSPYKYTADLFAGGVLYAVVGERLEAVEEYGPNPPSYSQVVHGDFLGNRMELIDGKVVIVDDELDIALGSRDGTKRGRASGLSYLKLVNTTDEEDMRHIKPLNNQFAETVEQAALHS